MRKLASVIGVLAFVGILGATETRVWTLAQGRVGFLTDDEVLIQIFPGQMFRFGSFVTVENPVVPGSSIAGVYRYASAFYTSEGVGFGLYLGRSRTIDMFTTTINVAPIDLVFGVRSGGVSFGLNLTLNKYSDKVYNANYKESATVFALRPGFTVDLGGNSYFDGAFFIDYTSGAVTDTLGSTLTEKSSTFGLGFQSRFAGPVLVPIRFSFYSTTDTLALGGTTRTSTIAAGAGVGNQITIDNGLLLGALCVSLYNMSRKSPADTTGATNIFIGTLVGGEFNVWRGLFVRGSLRYNFVNYASSSLGGTRTGSFTIGDFGPFTLGLGYDFGFARVDVGVSTDLLTNGPFFLTGNNGSGLITMLSLLGKF